MYSRRSARFLLRDATAEWHQRVDAVFSTADLADRAGYGQFLCAQAAAHVPVERALDTARLDNVMQDCPDRRRAHLIRDDLAALNLAIPLLEPDPMFIGVAAMLGATYVLEGSRLGGALLKRSIPVGFPTAFLSGGIPTAWRDLIALLDARLLTESDQATAIGAACATFALLEHSGRRFL